VRTKSMDVESFCIRDVITVDADTSIAQCAQSMHDDHVGSLVVTEIKNDRRVPVGIVTDRDIVIEVIACALDPQTITAGDIMAQPLVTARTSEDLMTALARMREHGVRRLPVVDDTGALAGILSADNLWEVLAEEMDGLVRVIKAEQLKEARTRPLLHKSR
jgi:CBS domain-containing protein